MATKRRRAGGGLWSGSQVHELTPEETAALRDTSITPGWEVFEGLIADLLGQTVSQLTRCSADESKFYQG